MLYKQRRRLYSQNNLVNPKLIAKLIRKSSLGKNDKVIEIGPGRGIITQELLKVAGRVTAIELDRKLYFHLKEKYKNAKNLELIRGDFLNFRMPPYSYKVFSNIPFNITSGVLRKLTDDDNFLEAYIFIGQIYKWMFSSYYPYHRDLNVWVWNKVVSSKIPKNINFKPWF